VQVVSTRVGKGPHPARPLYSEVTIETRPHFVDSDLVVKCDSVVVSGIPRSRVKSAIPGGLCYLLSLVGIPTDVCDTLASLIEAGPGDKAIKCGDCDELFSVQLPLLKGVEATMAPVLNRTEDGPVPLTNVVICEDQHEQQITIVVQFVPTGLILLDRQPLCSVRGIPPTDHYLCEGGRALVELARKHSVSAFPFVAPSIRRFKDIRYTEWIVIMVTVGVYSPLEAADAAKKICGDGKRHLSPFWVSLVPTETPPGHPTLSPLDFSGSVVTAIEGPQVVPIREIREVVEAGVGSVLMVCYATSPLVYKEAGAAVSSATELHIFRSKEAAGRPLSTLKALRDLLGPDASFKAASECVPGAEGVREIYARLSLEHRNRMSGYLTFFHSLPPNGKAHAAYQYFLLTQARESSNTGGPRHAHRPISEAGSSQGGGRSSQGGGRSTPRKGRGGGRPAAPKAKCKSYITIQYPHRSLTQSHEESGCKSAAPNAPDHKRRYCFASKNRNNFNEL